MNKKTADIIANELRIDFDKHKLHFGKLKVEVVEMISGGWKVQIY